MTLTDILSTILSVAMECFVLIYYSNSVMNYKYSQLMSNFIIAMGYMIYCGICLLEIQAFNIAGFIIITFCAIQFGYNDGIVSTALRTVVLTILMMFGEFIVALIMKIDITEDYYSVITVLV